MKKILLNAAFFLVILVILNSCKKESPETIYQPVNDTATVLKFQGIFASGPYGTVSGLAKVYLKQNKYTVALENFSSSNGPDLKVYISKEQVPVNFIKLSDLLSNNGNQLYEVQGNPDFADYKYVLIHCEQYNHLFGSAALN